MLVSSESCDGTWQLERNGGGDLDRGLGKSARQMFWVNDFAAPLSWPVR